MTDPNNSSDSFFENNFSDNQLSSTATATDDNHNRSSHSHSHSPEIDDEELKTTSFTLRALVTSKEAGVVIGKQGANVAEMRSHTEVKAGVSKPVSGVQERVLTISGIFPGVVEAFGMAAQTLIDSPPVGNYIHAISPPAPPGIATVRLLISHQQMGTVIGRQGTKIKSIQEDCKVRMVASKEMLPQSTERVVEIQGTADAVKSAIWQIGKCLIEDQERAVNTIQYNPQHRSINGNSNGNGNGSNSHHHHHSHSTSRQQLSGAIAGEQTNTLAVASDMVGCIIGKQGAKIQDIRRLSGARISIAKQAHDSTGKRLFTIKGTPEANAQAIDMLKQQLAIEESRRANEDNSIEEQDDQDEVSNVTAAAVV